MLETDAGTMLIVHLLVDCRDAMGANAVNTMCETIGPEVGELCKGVVVLKIISNLAVHRLARVTGVFTAKELSTSGDEEEGKIHHKWDFRCVRLREGGPVPRGDEQQRRDERHLADRRGHGPGLARRRGRLPLVRVL